ncbi:MAG TPA: GrpB family protein [Dongiaceae bacterium]|nr:GrpB family protein [Dongiaceae bacterium]
MDEIELVEYDPRWPDLFAEEAVRLRATLDPGLIVGLEHFGSTAISGMAAKPIIDILIAVRSLAEARAIFVEPLEELGYAFWSDNPKTDRLFFVKGMPPYGERRTHHVHVVEPTAEPWLRLGFRDYLRAHPDEARRYADLKRSLAAAHRTDREAYTDAKAAFVAEIMAKANSQRT